MSAPPSGGKQPAEADIDIEIEEEDDYSNIEFDEDEKKPETKVQPPAPRSPTPRTPDAISSVPTASTPLAAHYATAPTSALGSLAVPSSSSSATSSAPTASSLPQPLPSASSPSSSSSSSAHITRDLATASVTQTSVSPLSSTAASAHTSSQLYDSQTGSLSAVHHFSSPLNLGASSSTSASSSLSLTNTVDRQQQRTAAQLEQLVEALNADNARLLLQLKQRDAQMEQMTQQHSRDKKRLRDECEQARHELVIVQASKRTALEGEGEAGKEMARMREEWERERLAWRDRENQLLYELNRASSALLSTGSPPAHVQRPTSPLTRPPGSPRPVVSDDRAPHVAELQQLLRDREVQLHQQADKLAWYAENQQLLSDSQAALDQAHARIKQLERQTNNTSPTKGRGATTAVTSSEPRSLPADTKRIKQLEHELTQLRRRSTQHTAPAQGVVGGGVDREQAAVAGLIEAVRGGEEGEVVRELRGRVVELEAEVAAREAEWERRLRVMRQEQDKIRVGFEKKVRLLQEGVKGRLAQLKGKKRLGSVSAPGAEGVALSGGVDEVVKTMEARMDEMRERYEKQIQEMQSAAQQLQKQQNKQQHLSPGSPSRPLTAGSTATRTPLRSAARSSLRPPRSASASRLQSPPRSQPAAPQTSTAASAPTVPDIVQPTSPRARAAARSQQSHPLHSHTLPSVAAVSAASADLDAHFQQLHTLLHSSHRHDLTALATHYTQLLTTLQQHTRAQLDTMQQRLTATESERQQLADSIGRLQQQLWQREREAEEKGWEAERLREGVGVKEWVLLERQVREMEARLERREKEYKDEVEMAGLRAEEERVRLVDRFEAIVKRKNDQLRAFEHEMEQLIDLLHKTQQQVQQQNKKVAAAGRGGAAAGIGLRELDGEQEAVSGSVDAGSGGAVVNYVALLERLEQQQSAVYQQLTASTKGKENRGRVSLTSKSSLGVPTLGGAVTVAQSDKMAFRRASAGPGSLKRAPFAAPQPAGARRGP